MEKQPQNSQEMNEALDHLASPEPKPTYVIVNEATGTVNYYHNYADAIYSQPEIGGIIYNLATTDPHTVQEAIRNAKKSRRP